MLRISWVVFCRPLLAQMYVTFLSDVDIGDELTKRGCMVNLETGGLNMYSSQSGESERNAASCSSCGRCIGARVEPKTLYQITGSLVEPSRTLGQW